MKKIFCVIVSVILCVVFVVGLSIGGFFLLYTPSLTADLSVKTGDVTTGASGYLYGLAQPNVPSENMTESVDISTVSQKVANGLQHPIGDIDDVYTQLDNTKYNVVYLQDNYSTWYYDHSAIEEARANGTYDWKEYLNNDYLPKVKESINYLSKTPYSDKVVYCLYNECDNGIWFGETVKNDDGSAYGAYNEIGAQNFFEAWKITYDYVKSINPNAVIGGPGFYEYDHDKINSFLEYCVQNDCVPDVMIYHELNDYSIYFWQQHVSDYREIEKSLDLQELPIIVTEYGRMCDNGLPGKMLQYITQIETTKVYADNAYWRLADNLCDVSADDNMPNSNWWLYRWYTDMEGQTVSSKYQDLFKSNFENAYIKRKAEYTSQGFMGVVSMTDNEDKVDIICGGRSGSAVVKLKNINSTGLAGKNVHIKIEEVLYKGISGVVTSPVVLQEYDTALSSKLTIDLNDMDEANAYHITITESTENDFDTYKNDTFIKRYEFENGEILGNAYTYNSAYATTGEEDGMLGGMENEGDGVTVTINVPREATYDLNFIYGNSNDGEYDENGQQNPDDRTYSVVSCNIDDNKEDITLANTIKSEYTDCYTKTMQLSAGKHTITIKHNTGTIVLDSLLVVEKTNEKDISVLPDADRTNDNIKSYLVVVPTDGYYNVVIDTDSDKTTAYINDNKFEMAVDNTSSSLNNNSSVVYLMRGLNYIDFESEKELESVDVTSYSDYDNSIAFGAEDAVLSGEAKISTNSDLNCSYISGISCNSGEAEYTINVEKSGTYAMTITYANNDEGGKHDYNVDLIERYVTVTANGKSQDVYCRNTYSWDTYKTVTTYVKLKKGENKITLSNSGNNKFDNEDTYAPYINCFTINEISL